jgi:hypothetical protein
MTEKEKKRERVRRSQGVKTRRVRKSAWTIHREQADAKAKVERLERRNTLLRAFTHLLIEELSLD